MKYRAPQISRKEILSFCGSDKDGAWREALRLAELVVNKGSADVMGVKAELQRGEWVVVLCHYQ